jgi:putative ABC transport system permease protein
VNERLRKRVAKLSILADGAAGSLAICALDGYPVSGAQGVAAQAYTLNGCSLKWDADATFGESALREKCTMGAGWIETLGQDLRYAIRRLRKSPGFTLVAVLSLAIGISANTTIFSVINGVLLRPLPYPDQDRLVTISNISLRQPEFLREVSAVDLARWRAENQVFEQLEITSRPDLVAMSSAGNPERVGVQHVSPGLFSLLGMSAALGTLPSEPEISRKGFDGVVLSYEFWQRHFAGDPKVLGQRIVVDNDAGTVLAVLNPSFDLFGKDPAEIFGVEGVPSPSESAEGRWEIGLGKLKPGVTLQQAQASMDVVARHLEQAYPEDNRGLGLSVRRLQQGLFGWMGRALYFLFAAVVFVLLIACANIANLLLSRADTRRKEIGVRIALGASRWRLIRQMLTETALLALLGGIFGLILSVWGIKLFSAFAPRSFPHIEAITIDSRVLVFTFAICVLAGVVFGLAPAFRTSKTGVNNSLKEGGRSSGSGSRHRTRSTLVVAEVALALLLLVCAGLMINTLVHVFRADPGFNPSHLLTMEIRLTGKKYIDASQGESTGLNAIKPQVGLFCRQVLERVKALPGVESAALIDWLPMSEDAEHFLQGVTILGQPAVLPDQRPRVMFSSVSSDYFHVMSIPVRRGRGLREQDTESAPWIAVINEAMARKFWPGQDAIGQVITLDTTPDEQPREIVGIVGNVRQYELAEESQPEVYAPYQQQTTHSTASMAESRVHKSLVIRMSFFSKDMIESVRKTVTELVDDSPVFGITSVEQTVSNSARPESFFAQVLGVFAAVALLLATIGVYGVISYSVSERNHEIGLRMALGAQSGQVLGLVLQEGLTLSLLGVAIGLAASVGVTPVISRFLYGVQAHDPLTLALVSLLLIGVTILATYVPARRATQVDPLVILRHE